MEGVVVKTTGSWHTVRTAEGKTFDCSLKGVFRIKGLKATNPVAIGDRVEFDPPGTRKHGTIHKIYERKNYIIRKATKLSKSVHIIAANIDRAFVVATLALPRTSTGFIDRFLVTAEAYKIPAALIFNKIDIYDEELNDYLRQLCALYEKIGYPCYPVSALEGTNISHLREVLKDKINLFSGHSGVGKTAILNALDPSLNLKTGDISYYHQKGKHTTTFAEMFSLDFGGFVIDTPGIKEFGLVDFYREELTHYFPEMFKLLPYCRFHNCTHISEPGCAVKEALERGEISETRYINYTNIFFGRDIEN